MPSVSAAADVVASPAVLLAEAAAEDPGKLAVVEASGRSLTWAGLDDEAGRVATGLARLGVLAGHRVVLVCGNRLELVAAYLGVLRAQAIAVPIDPASSANDVARVLADSGARLVLAEPATATTVREAVAALEPTGPAPRVVVVDAAPRPGEHAYADLCADAARPAPPLTDPERVAALLWTSGTTGLPRGAMLSHRALAAGIAQVAAVEPAVVRGDDVVLGVLPLFHVYGLNAVLGGVLRSRAKLVLAERFDPQGTLDLIDDEACSVVPIAPAVLDHWRDLDLEGRLAPVRLVLCGSAPLAADVASAFTARTGVPVHQGYGLTEAAPVVTSTLCSADPAPGSVGAPLGGVELRLVDTAGAVVPPGSDDAGEVQVRGANLFSGYWPDGADGPDADGWWSTGDLAFLDARGDVTLVDRAREVVVVSGFSVYPVEVEAVVAEVDGVVDVAVIGVADEQTVGAVVAYVVAPDRDPAAVADDVRAACAAGLAAFKVPSRVEVVARLPHGVTGTVQKGRLRRLEHRRDTGRQGLLG
jgi:long-chain acyl-CoA synthetase